MQYIVHLVLFYLYLTFILLFCVLYVGRLLSLLHMYASRPVRQGGLPFLKAKPHILLYCTGMLLWLFILPFCCFFMLLICVSIIYVCRVGIVIILFQMKLYGHFFNIIVYQGFK